MFKHWQGHYNRTGTTIIIKWGSKLMCTFCGGDFLTRFPMSARRDEGCKLAIVETTKIIGMVTAGHLNYSLKFA